MGINVKPNVTTKKKATLRMFNQLNTYLFEEQYGELDKVSPVSIKKIKEAAIVLQKIAIGR